MKMSALAETMIGDAVKALAPSRSTPLGIHLEVEGKVPGIDSAKFVELAETAKKGCPISRALAATPISMSAKLL